MGWHDNLPFMRSNDPRFPIHRRIFQAHFSKSESRNYEDMQLMEARKLVRKLVDSPQDWHKLFRTYVAFSISLLISLRLFRRFPLHLFPRSLLHLFLAVRSV